MIILKNIDELLEDIKENQENYNQVIDGIIEELKCEDCIELDCRYCRLKTLKELQSNINKICDL